MRGSGPAVSPPPGFPSACLRESRGFVFAYRSLPSALNPLAIALGFFLSVCGIVVATRVGCQCATPSKRIVLVGWDGGLHLTPVGRRRPLPKRCTFTMRMQPISDTYALESSP